MRHNRQARRARNVSSQRLRREPGPPLEGQPTPEFTAYLVHGRPMQVEVQMGDRVLLVGNTAGLRVGLLIKWLGFAWRVYYVDDSTVVLEGWGADFMRSPKLAQYDTTG